MRRDIGVFLFIIVLLTLSVGCKANTPDEFSDVASIGGEPVALGEVKMFLSDRPEQTVQSALNELAPFIVCRRELKRLGGETFASYKEFWDAWQVENARRMTALERGEIVYGPETLTQSVYYSYMHEADMRQLAKLMEASPTEAELHAAYEERTDLFTVMGSVNMRVILLPLEEDIGVIDKLKVALAAGEGYDAAVERLGLGDKTYPRSFTASDFRHPDVTEFDGVADAIRDLAVGEFWEPIDNNGVGWIVLYCESRDGEGRETFEECRATLMQLLTDEGFEHEFATLVEAAIIIADDGLDALVRQGND